MARVLYVLTLVCSAWICAAHVRTAGGVQRSVGLHVAIFFDRNGVSSPYSSTCNPTDSKRRSCILTACCEADKRTRRAYVRSCDKERLPGAVTAAVRPRLSPGLTIPAAQRPWLPQHLHSSVQHFRMRHKPREGASQGHLTSPPLTWGDVFSAVDALAWSLRDQVCQRATLALQRHGPAGTAPSPPRQAGVAKSHPHRLSTFRADLAAAPACEL